MRTTLTLEDDVAVQIERLRKSRDAALKDIVNEALRLGLKEMTAKPKKQEPFRTSVHHGKLLIMDVKEALAILDEEEDRRKLGQ
ncbi:MAG: CopG family transcriptional regulator [Alphaproteobacteria bacterium]|nr:CopG family transcriptional regulator [Alphaproteobacteria bacterium]